MNTEQEQRLVKLQRKVGLAYFIRKAKIKEQYGNQLSNYPKDFGRQHLLNPALLDVITNGMGLISCERTLLYHVYWEDVDTYDRNEAGEIIFTTLDEYDSFIYDLKQIIRNKLH